MIERKQFTTKVGGKEVTLEVSELAEQANAAVFATCGQTTVLATVVMGFGDKPLDYLPLKVDYEERFYAAGKIIGSRFIRREGRPSDEAILTGRLIDRTIRPLFDHRIRREIQVVITVISFDEENEPDFIGLLAASAALSISDVPFAGPVGGIRVAKVSDEFVVNPSHTQMISPECAFETFASGPKEKINMIELSGYEIPESEIVKAFAIAQKEIDSIVAFQEKIVREIGKTKEVVALAEIGEDVKKSAREFLSDKLDAAVYQKDKKMQAEKLFALKKEYFAHVKETYAAKEEEAPTEAVMNHVFEDMVDALIHKNTIAKGLRPDFRAVEDLRELKGEVGLLPRTHGSAVFMRGSTQALAVTTLGSPGASQIVETMQTDEKRRFLLHYNFPPYSVGETGMFRGPGRREIGHGSLARKALEPVIPPAEEFPYTIRVVSEILSSNGSSSMATVCATTLSLMDAGVPIKKPVAGIAMGLMSDAAGNYKILTDLQGPEDHYGDMDFKVAGTESGVNAIQLDTKISGLTMEMIEETMSQARDARLTILSFMKGIIESPRSALSPHAPCIMQLIINPEKIGMVIGPGGKMINGLIDKYKLDGIDIEEDGRVAITGTKREDVETCFHEIEAMTRDYKTGEIVEGRVVRIMDFGAIIDIGGGADGMVHVSELKEGFTKSVRDVLKEGDVVKAKIIRVEDGKIGLSIKQL
jgi:polyribonucleotide nucleotidyltransferase